MTADDFESINYGFESDVQCAALPPAWNKEEARELVDDMEALLEDSVPGPEEEFIPLDKRAVVPVIRARLRALDPMLIPEFDLRMQQVCDEYGGLRFVSVEEPESFSDTWQMLHDHVCGFIAWLVFPKPAPVYPGNHLHSALQTSAQGSACPVVLQGEGKPIQVRSKEVAPLGQKQYQVMRVVVDRYPDRTPLGIFEARNISDAAKVLKRINELSGWEGVVYFPRGKGKGGYGLNP